ncbi:MAG: hypothetical protein ICV83_05755 [Cytophagales bacterium]|nr:hypothetical protein [Cytophagales bacterium]
MSLSLVLLIVAAVVLGGNILLLGLPGALLLILASGLVKPLGWKGIDDQGDRAWPLAIVATAAWGVGLLPLWGMVNHLRGPAATVWLLWGGWGLLLGVGLLAYCHATGKSAE